MCTDWLSVSSLDGVTLAPGGIDGNGIQVGKQFAEITAISAYSFLVSCALLMILKYIPGLHLRVSNEAEERGLDLDQFFDEEIGDWGVFDELEKRRILADTLVGQVGATSSAENVQTKNGPGGEVKTA